MVWELVGFSTEERGENAVRYRAYTTSERRALDFEQIPRIQFSDSGHGIVFQARRKAPGRRKPVKHMDYVGEQLALIRAAR